MVNSSMGYDPLQNLGVEGGNHHNRAWMANPASNTGRLSEAGEKSAAEQKPLFAI